MKNNQKLYNRIMEANKEFPKGVFIAAPMYGGQCSGDFALSLSKAVVMLKDLGFQYHVQALYNESLIPRGRNTLARDFMDSGMDYLMFIDSDIGFPELGLLSLIVADNEVSGAAYPKKKINWDLVSKAVKAGKTTSELSQYTGEFTFDFEKLDAETDDSGFVEVRHISTGFMLLRRSVLEKLREHVPAYTEPHDGSLRYFSEFFKSGPCPKTGAYLSEDYWFCDSWRLLGGKIYMNPFIHLTHCGMYQFNGSLSLLGTEVLSDE